MSYEEEKYWFNTKTGKVEKGRKSSFENRLGPYDSEAEAQAALATASERNREWDEDDEDWR